MARRGRSRPRADPNQLSMDFLWGSDEPDVEEQTDEPVRDNRDDLLPRPSAGPVRRDREPGRVLPGPGRADPGPGDGTGDEPGADGTGSAGRGLPGQDRPAE